MTDYSNGDELFEQIRSALAMLTETWLGLVSDEQKSHREVYLAAASIRMYLKCLPGITRHETGGQFLPACFEIYASCVGEIMKVCNDLGKKGSTIKITTLLTKPLSSWYNISLETGPKPKYLNCALTSTQWETYKSYVVKLNDRENNIHNIQMRRIVTLEAYEEGKPLLVYVTEGGTAITVKQARSIRGQMPDWLHLNESVSNTIDCGKPDWRVHLIGTCSGENHYHNNWQSVTKHFEYQYHVSRHNHENFVQNNEKGVFYAVVSDIGHLKPFEDLFIVDMSSFNGGTFGIAFDVDQRRRLPGMFFLTDEEMKVYIETLDSLWKKAGE